MVVSAHIHSQGTTWTQRQEQKWETLAGKKMDQLDSLFEDHLRWFRQHRTATSLIATRRPLTKDETTEIGHTKRTRLDDETQDHSESQENSIDHETNNKQNPPQADASMSISFDDGALDTPTQDNHLPTTHDTPNEANANNVDEDSTQPPAKISREYLLRHFEQEERKHGRYGLRKRSLGSSLATTALSTQSINSVDTPEQQRRKTTGGTDGDNGDISSNPTDVDTIKETATIKDTAATEKIPLFEPTTSPPPEPATSLPSDTPHTTPLTSQEPNTPAPKDQRHRTYGQEEQIDDEVLLLSRPTSNNNSTTALNDGSSRLDQHSGLGIGGGGANNSLLANESYSFSSIFSFKRASSSVLEPSIHYDGPNISIISNSNNKSYTPRRPTDSYHSRPSRLTHPSPSTSSKGKRTVSASPGTTTRVDGRTKSSSTTSMLSKHRSYTPAKPWNATPVSSSFLSSSTIYSSSSLKRDSSRHINISEASSHKKSSKENGEIRQDQNVTEEPDETNEPQAVNDTTTDEPPEPTSILIPSWASHPELDQLLQEQVKMDADKIFGKMPPLQVSQIVKMSGY